MRVVVKDYASGGRGVFETTNDGSETVGEWAGPRKVGDRVSAYVEVISDDAEQDVERLLATLAWLAEEIRRRKGQAVGEKAASGSGL